MLNTTLNFSTLFHPQTERVNQVLEDLLRMYVPNVPKVKLLILDEIHKNPYSSHPGYQKTITMLRKEYFWPNMKTEVAEYIARCFECQQVKAEHQHPAGLLQLLPIPSWKWEIISLRFCYWTA